MQKTIADETANKKDIKLDISTDLSKEDFVKLYSLRPRGGEANKIEMSDSQDIADVDDDGLNDREVGDEGEGETMEVQKSENTDQTKDTVEPVTADAKGVKEKKMDVSSENTDITQEQNNTVSSVTPSTGKSEIDDTDKDPNFTLSQNEKESDATLTADNQKIPEELKPTNTKRNKKTDKKEKEGKKKEKTVDNKKDEKKSKSDAANKQKKSKDAQASTSNASTKSENTDEHDKPDDGKDNFGFYCDKCFSKFDDWKEMQIHKLDCVKIP